MRFEYVAGERMFVDFCGDTVPITDPETGEIWQAQVFVSVLWNQKSTAFPQQVVHTSDGGLAGRDHGDVSSVSACQG